ncbi:translation initiation factor IF-2-like isoform X1 [Trachypithecus francoisi]|uniref:translation initiation factor IF-2-like isoform X1 n=1 Tax=Trachypithecus francoisi TaxID=54180 RepID=UPI00141BA476|nr:translation initiation factor IF-2-like isoform X1 [Trachypithecus francoisi]XP_033075272.1 translation initiation factor IF-2-like isoform X1 [Trachypithecus francoisi]
MGGSVSCGRRPPQPPLGPGARGRPETVRDGPRASAGEAPPPSPRPDAPSVASAPGAAALALAVGAPEGRVRLPPALAGLPGPSPRRRRRRLPARAARPGKRGRGLHGQRPRPAAEPPRSRAALGARIYSALLWDTPPLDLKDSPHQH